jgi:hypothetical protein
MHEAVIDDCTCEAMACIPNSTYLLAGIDVIAANYHNRMMLMPSTSRNIATVSVVC